MKGIIESRHKLEFMEAHNVDEPLLKLEDHMVARSFKFQHLERYLFINELSCGLGQSSMVKMAYNSICG